nr:hypothetical protein [Burkholderia cenocepacia]
MAPTATLDEPVAEALFPIAIAFVPVAVAASPVLLTLKYVSSTFLDKAVFIWPTFTASLSSVPAATLTIWRVKAVRADPSAFAVVMSLPTENALTRLVPVFAPSEAELAPVVRLYMPIATAPLAVVLALVPNATVPAPPPE